MHYGFCKPYRIPPDTNEILFTVPEDQQFVITRLYAFKGTDNDVVNHSISYNWKLTVDDVDFLNGFIIYAGFDSSNSNKQYKFFHEFPDKCVVVPANAVLSVCNLNDIHDRDLFMTIIGYYTDIDQSFDFNQDGIVNFLDFALFAESWLE
jgi:hypothetical protein